MLRIFYYEILKTFLKKRTYIGYGLLIVIIPLIEVAFKLQGSNFLSVAMRGLSKDFFFAGNFFNGWLVAHQIMNSLWFHIPLLISFVAGDQLAGEATAGTYRLLLVHPPSRSVIFFSKYLVTLFYTMTFVLFLAALSIGLALLLLGSGDLIVIASGGVIIVFSENDIAWRFCVAYAIALWTMLIIASISVFFSSFVENAIGPIVATMGTLIIFTIISTMPVQMFEAVKPFLFTTYMDAWMKVFSDPIPWNEIFTSILCYGVYNAVACLAAWFVFVRKDILT